MTVAFRYRAARADGKVIAGVVESPNSAEASRQLTDRGLHPLALDPTPARSGGVRSAPKRELAALFQGLAALVGAGVPIVRAVEAIRPSAGPRLATGMGDVARELREGRSFGEALVRLDGLVPGIVVGIIRSGERASRLAAALDEVATHLELEADLESRLRQALAYPAILCVAGLASTVVISTVVIPRFAVILGDLGQGLPASTRLLLSTSAFLQQWWWLLLVGTVLLAILATRALQEEEHRRTLNEFLLGVPLLGATRHSFATARASRAAASALASGVPLLPSLAAASEAAGDVAVRHRLTRSAAEVSAGAPLAPSLVKHRALTASALQLVAVGEASGQLASMFRRAGGLAGQEGERRLRTLVGLVEPGLVLLFGGLVAFVAAALLQAVYSLRP